MPYLELKDKNELYFNDWGKGTPIVLIHGWPLNSGMWEHQASFLVNNGYRVISYDRRGFGKSSMPWAGHNYDTFADDLSELMIALDLHNAVLVGFSMGGGEVVRYLSRHGAARVAKAVLISAITPIAAKLADNPDGVPEDKIDEIKANLVKDRFGFLQTFFKSFYGVGLVSHPVSQGVLDWSFIAASQACGHATLQDVTAFMYTDFRAEMKTLQTPFLIIHGSADKTIPVETAGRQAAKILPHNTYLEYDGEPHALTSTAPDRLNADLLNFIGGDHNTVPRMEQI